MPFITARERETVAAIVNVFETGSVEGRYDAVVAHPDDTGGLTYGRSQATLTSGNLARLISAYVQAEGASFAGNLLPYLPRLEARDERLNREHTLHDVLRRAGSDPVMVTCQDRFFTRHFWQPAWRSAVYLGALNPLSAAIIYDSRVHGSWHRLRNRVLQSCGPVTQVGERAWFRRYLAERGRWLGRARSKLLRKTVYRVEALQALLDAEAWDLPLPLTVHGVAIPRADDGGAPAIYEPASRVLYPQTPALRGEDVTALQWHLRRLGHKVSLSGGYDQATAAAVARIRPEIGQAPLPIVNRIVLRHIVETSRARACQPFPDPQPRRRPHSKAVA